MILTVDIGNTNITMGAYRNGSIVFTTKIYTDRKKSTDEYAVSLLDIFSLNNVSADSFRAAILSSVVPEITPYFSAALEKITGREPLLVGEKHNGNLKVEILPVSALGADLVAASVGAISKYPLPCLVADLGTATKILVIDKNGVFRGCTISPGVRISLEALSQRTSLLPTVSLSKPPHAIGENTVECMQSGIVFGTAAMLDGLIKRIKTELSEDNVTVVATGGYSKNIVPCCETEMIFDENLLLDGLMEIYRRATE